MRWPALLTVAALAAVAVVTAWWLSSALRAPADLTADRGPAWYFHDAQVAATGHTGYPLYRVDAARIVHDPTDDSARLVSPHLQWLQGDGPPLLIAATAGRIHADRRRVSLSEGVTIIDESTGSRFEFRSPDLEIDADTRIAHTGADVIILSLHGELTGRGLIADMNDGTIRIESSVRGRYVR